MTHPSETPAVVRKGEYARNGDFHRDLDPNWSYYPVYVNKVELVDALLRKYGSPQGQTLDAGCGEGVLVEKYASQGWNIRGFDKNYASEHVIEGSMQAIPFEKSTFDTVLCLDVLEHLPFEDQITAVRELHRVTRNGGHVIVSVPNLAHFTSRLKFMVRGHFLRTASQSHHPGDRPAMEYEELLRERGVMKILEKHGIFPTVPPIYRIVMKNPGQSAGLLRFLRKLPLPVYWHFQVLFVCQVTKPE